MEIQVEIRKLHALIQNLLFFKEIPLLMLTSQNKALFQARSWVFFGAGAFLKI